MRSMLLIRGEPVQLVALQDAVDGGPGNRDLVEPLEVVRDLAGAEVVLLP